MNRFFMTTRTKTLFSAGIALFIAGNAALMTNATFAQSALESNSSDSTNTITIPENDTLKFAVIPDSLALDSVLSDSTAPDSTVLDSTQIAFQDSLKKAATDSLKAIRKAYLDRLSAIRSDTLAPTLATPLHYEIRQAEVVHHIYHNVGDWATLMPGLNIRYQDLYGQSYYASVPGGSGRDVQVLYRGRPLADPMTDATNFTCFAPEEFTSFAMTPAWSGDGAGNSGPVITASPQYAYPDKPTARITYYQEFHGLGSVDWKISQQVNDLFAYHFGVNIGEYRGRLPNSNANVSNVRLGGQSYFDSIGLVKFYWMQSRLDRHRPYEAGSDNTHRNDVDLIVSKGISTDPGSYEYGFWYTRVLEKYNHGHEDGNRLGFRFDYQRNLADTHVLRLRADAERTGVLFEHTPGGEDHKADRLVTGTTLSDDLTLGNFVSHTTGRMEWGKLDGQPATSDPYSGVQLSAAWSGDYKLAKRWGVNALASTSSRWPSLDETFGYWTPRSPDRRMDPVPIPDRVQTSSEDIYYRFNGNSGLKPIRTVYAGIGPRFRNKKSGDTIQLAYEIRSWDSRYTKKLSEGTARVLDFTWKTDNKSFYTQGATLSLNHKLFGPIDMAGAFTWVNGLNSLHDPVPDYFGWGGLRYFGEFYNGQLKIWADASARAFDSYYAKSGNSSAYYLIDRAFFLDLTLRIRIQSFEFYYGSTNMINQYYEYIPGNPVMHKEDVFGIRWILLN